MRKLDTMLKNMNKNYEIALSTDVSHKWQLDEYDIKDFVWVLYKLGFSVYRGIDNQICFSATDEEVTEVNENK